MLKCASKKKTLNIHAHAGMQIPSINTAMRSSMVGICVLYWTSGNGFCSVQSSRENTEWILLHSRVINLAERWSKYWRDDFNRHAFVISVSYISWIDESLSMQAHYPLSGTIIPWRRPTFVIHLSINWVFFSAWSMVWITSSWQKNEKRLPANTIIAIPISSFFFSCTISRIDRHRICAPTRVPPV